MSVTSPNNPAANNPDTSYRKLPALRELLSPTVTNGSGHASSNATIPSQPLFPSLSSAGSYSSPISTSFPPLSAYARNPPPPGPRAWHFQPPPPAQRTPDKHETLAYAQPQAARGTTDEAAAQRERPLLPGQTTYPHHLPQRPSLSATPASEYRSSLAPAPHGLHDDPRRDSARSASLYSTNSADCIGQQHFPGRGLCYVYSDGATCPTVIDGELVNPMWGTTKAGKARKRLAQACLNCREKKIRCEPKHPRCVQCEKSKRECIMPVTQQGPQDQLMLSASAPHLPALSPAPTRYPAPANGNGSIYGSNKRRRSNDEQPHNPMQAPARDYQARAKNEHQYDRSYEASPISRGSDARSDAKTDGERDSGLISGPQSTSGPMNTLDWDTDAYEVNSIETTRLLDAFFAHNISVSSTMFPKLTFQRWVLSNRRKSPLERMVLYSMLALGAGVTRDTSRFGRLCAERATAAVASNFGKFNLLLAQSRIFLALYGHAVGQPHQASEYYSAAIHLLRMGKYNTEDGCDVTLRSFETTVFDMNANQLMECMRRTFWAGSLLDTVWAVCNNFSSILPSMVINLRLPCKDLDYEQGVASKAPFFENDTHSSFVHNRPDLATCSPLAFAIVISRVAASVGLFVNSSVSHPTSAYPIEYGKFLRTTEDQLARWYNCLPPVLSINGLDLAGLVEKNATILITSMATFYHMSLIHSTRFVRHKLLDRSVIIRNIHRANESSRQVLQLSATLCSIGQNLPEGQSLQNLMSPTFAYAVFLAVDTLCAGGLHSDTREMLSAVMHGCTTFDTIGYVWSFARPRMREYERRLAKIQQLLTNPDAVVNDPEVTVDQVGWRFRGSMEKHFEHDHDLAYGLDARDYLSALGA